MTYDIYKKKFAEEIENTDPDQLNDLEKNRHEARVINYHRTNRLEKYFLPSEITIDEVRRANTPQIWFVLTENWCGDSAQILPIVKKIADLNSEIELRIFLRDLNPEMMDRYLTNGSRSIPKIISFDKSGNEIFQWGPRPKPASQLVSELKYSDNTKNEINKQLHLWYGRNRGVDVESELLSLIRECNTAVIGK